MQFTFGKNTIRVNIASQALLMQQVSNRFAANEGFALATINLDHLVKLTRQPEFCEAYAAHDLIVADGNPIVWLSRLAGKPVALMPGSDLVLPLARLAADSGVSVALVGSTALVLKQAAARLENEVLGLKIVLELAPDFGFDPGGAAADKVLNQIASSGADLCFLAFGAPKQEILAARGRAFCPNVGFVSIGAGLDFLANTQKRAPAWVRSLALEWLWRALSNPRRLGLRYIRSGLILPGHVVKAVQQRFSG